MTVPKIVEPTDVQSSPLPVSPPKASAMLREARAVFDMGSLPLNIFKSMIRSKAVGAEHALPIVTLPGFASDQKYMKPLEAYLRNLGYQTEDWGLGVNLAGMNLPHRLEELSETWDVEYYQGYTPEAYRGEGGVPYLCDRVTDQIRDRSQALGSPVTLIGWSLGGYVAREVARELPKEVAHVITLGSPVIGGPKYTKAAALFKRKGFDLDWIETQSGKRDNTPIEQPITAIFSKTDGVVGWQAALDRVSPNVTHIEVNVPHLGMGFNSSVWALIEDSLARHGMAC